MQRDETARNLRVTEDAVLAGFTLAAYSRDTREFFVLVGDIAAFELFMQL